MTSACKVAAAHWGSTIEWYLPDVHCAMRAKASGDMCGASRPGTVCCAKALPFLSDPLGLCCAAWCSGTVISSSPPMVDGACTPSGCRSTCWCLAIPVHVGGRCLGAGMLVTVKAVAPIRSNAAQERPCAAVKAIKVCRTRLTYSGLCSKARVVPSLSAGCSTSPGPPDPPRRKGPHATRAASDSLSWRDRSIL